MHQIICPHCKQAFTIDEAGYADIVRRVRNDEFAAELHERLAAAEREKVTAIELATAKLSAELKDAAASKDAKIERLKAALKSTEVEKELAVKKAVEEVSKGHDDEADVLVEAAAKKDAEIERLKGEIKTAEVAKQLALKEATASIAKERDDLARDLKARDGSSPARNWC